MNRLPLISYPLTVALIDDDSLILEALSELLKNEYSLKSFNDPTAAMHFFENYTPISSLTKFLQGCAESENYDTSGHLPVDIDIDGIQKLLKNNKRSDEISVLVIDYNMPRINGIDFCRQLKALPIKKILLTGEASDLQAIKAFNEGIIDCFIRKNSPSLAEDLRCHIKLLTQKYQSNTTQQLLNHLETDRNLPASDPAFITFFNEWCKAHHIKEYAIIDQNSNFLLINEDNDRSFFITHTNKTLEDFVKLHKDNNDVTDLLLAVKNREKIPSFCEDNESLETSEWSNCFYTPQILNGREKYFYCIHKI